MRRLDLRSSGAWLVGVAVALALASLPTRVSAGGFEVAGAGTRPLGRGGAFAARADDGMALLLNPAMMADLGEHQLMINVHLALWDACVQRPGTYMDGYGGGGPASDSVFSNPMDPMGTDAWIMQAYPRVCNSGIPQLIPQIAQTIRILPELAIGFGIVAPNAVGTSQFGDGNGRVANGTLPTPVRYALSESSLLLFHPSIGIGYRPHPMIRIGATFQWGIGIISFTNYTNVGQGAEDVLGDIRTRLEASDFFVPAGIFSVALTPHPNFDIMIAARFSDSIDAEGHLDLTTGTYGPCQGSTDCTDPLSVGGSAPLTSRVGGVSLHAGQPFQFTLGMRYADRRWGRPTDDATRAQVMDASLGEGVVNDPMMAENFDIELDVVYELNSQVTDFVVRPPAGASVVARSYAVGTPIDINVPVPGPLPIPHGWQDTLSMRLGGDYNVLPGVLAIRAGTHVDLPMGQSRFQINDFVQGWRVGLHVGATLRIERFDISLAYSHVFAETLNITNGDYRLIAATGMQGVCGDSGDYDPNRPVSSRGCWPRGAGGVVNNGTYTQEWNFFSVGMTYHFN